MNPLLNLPIAPGGGSSSSGDVVGPGSSVSGNLASFSDASGTLLADSGVAAASVVVGPATSTDNAVVRFDGTTGKLLQGSLVTISDTSGNITVPANASVQSASGLMYVGAGQNFSAASSVAKLTSSNTIGFLPGSNHGVGNDTALSRGAAGILAVGTGAAGDTGGWVASSSNVALAADYTNATATMSNITGLSRTLLAGRKYTFKMVLFLADSVAAEGVKIDFDGGTATATNFRAHGTLFDTALLLSTQTTAIATDMAQATVTGDGYFEVYGSFEVNAAGTFIPRAAQNTHATGVLTIYRGSNLWIQDTTFA